MMRALGLGHKACLSSGANHAIAGMVFVDTGGV